MKRPNALAARLLCIAAAACILSGCTSDGGITYDSVYEGFTGEEPMPAPSEAVRMMFNREDADARRRGVAWLSTSQFGGGDEYVAAYRVLINDPDPGVRAAIATALGMHGTVADTLLLANMLSDEDALVRWRAADALGKIHNPDAVPALVQRLDPQIEEDPDTRAAAAMALGQYPDRVVLSRLIAALGQPDYHVARAAYRSLQTLTGGDLGSDPRDWANWSAQTANPFANQRPYTYSVYQPTRGWFDKYITFWNNDDDDQAQRPPRGLTSATNP